MREAFVILLVIGLLLALTAVRYRKQILAVHRFWRMLRDVQQNNSRTEMQQQTTSEIDPLVNCAKCGKWVPETRSIRLGTRMFYCSSNCLEKAASAA
jgi:hypothetical protein